MNEKILITGAGGYIGSVATYIFLQAGYEVVAVDSFEKGYKEPLDLLEKKYGKKKIRYYSVNLTNPKDLERLFFQEKGISGVVHFAAYCSVNESMVDPGKYFENNVHGSLLLLKHMVQNDIKKIVFSSTCAVYGEAEYVPVDEQHPTSPSNPYGESKLIVEKILSWYHKVHNVQYVVLRYFNVCGASDDGFIGDSKKPSVHMMQNAVRGALGIEDFYLTCPTIADNPDNTPIRDYLNVVDLSEAHILAITYLQQKNMSNVFNLGTGTGNSVLEVVNRVQEATGKSISTSQGESRKGEYAKMIASIEKAKKLLGWHPKRSIEDSVRSLITWYTKNPNGWNY